MNSFTILRSRIVHYPFFLSLISGLLMGSAFLHPFLWWAGVLGLALFIFAIEYMPSRRRAFWYGTLAGSLKMLLVLEWFWSVYPLSWMGDFSPTLQIIGIGWMWLTASVVIGLGLGCFSYCVYPYTRHPYRYWILPVLYVASEILGSTLFSIFEQGPGSMINAHFSFGYLGYTFAQHGLIGLLALGTGVYTLSLFGALSALFCKEVGKKYFAVPLPERRFPLRYATLLLLFLTTYFLPPLHPSDKGLTVTTVNTYFENQFNPPASLRAERVRALVDAFSHALESETDVVIFPEAQNALSVFGTLENVSTFVQTKTSREVSIVDSDIRKSETGASVIRAVLYDTKSQTAGVRYKRYLVPGGEFVPDHLALTLSLFGFRETSNALDTVMSFVPRDEDDVPESGMFPGVLFCSENISPIDTFVASREATLPLVAHPVSHAWFNTPHSLWYQFDSMLRTQVRMARTPLVQAANMWESRAYDSYGFPIEGEEVWKGASTTVVQYKL